MTSLKYGGPLGGFTDRSKKPITVRSVTGLSTFSAFIYKCVLNVDWDGAPNAYGLDRPGMPDQTGLDPWESRQHGGGLGNARTGADWGKEWCAVYNVTREEAIRILRLNGLIPPKPLGRGLMSFLRRLTTFLRSSGTIAPPRSTDTALRT